MDDGMEQQNESGKNERIDKASNTILPANSTDTKHKIVWL